MSRTCRSIRERLDFVDVITSSHNHTDHLDAETLVRCSTRPERERRSQFAHPEAATSPPRIVNLAADRCSIGLDDGKRLKIERLRVHRRARRPSIAETDDQGGHFRFLGYVIRCRPVDDLSQRRHDAVYDGMVDRLATFHIDVAILPINGQRSGT